MKIKIKNAQVLYGRDSEKSEALFFKPEAFYLRNDINSDIDNLDLDFYIIQANDEMYSLLEINYGKFFIKVLNNIFTFREMK